MVNGLYHKNGISLLLSIHVQGYNNKMGFCNYYTKSLATTGMQQHKNKSESNPLNNLLEGMSQAEQDKEFLN